MLTCLLSVQKPGYFTRQLTKNFENLDEQHGGIGSIRDDGGNVIQFKYGEDGFDPMCLVKQNIEELREYTVNSFLKEGGWFNDDLPQTEWLELWAKLAHTSFCEASKLIQISKNYAARLPLDVRHVLHAVMDQASDAPSKPQMTGRVLEVIFRGICILYFKTIRPSLHNAHLSHMVAFIIVRDLQPAYVLPHIRSGRLTTQKVREVIDVLKYRWARALIQPGEKVGVIAAQSLGQLAMQV